MPVTYYLSQCFVPSNYKRVATFTNIMNYPNRNSSSSSGSDEDQADAVGCYAMPTGRTEEHLDKHCKYQRYHDIYRGQDVYFLIRKCKCGRYEDRSYLVQGKMDFVKMDGKEIHYSARCKWKKNRRMTHGRKRYMLSACCNGCIQPQAYHSVRAMNHVQHFY